VTACQRGTQAWPILLLVACRRETITYDLLGKLIGVSPKRLGNVLEPIQSYCILQGLAPLTSLVVDETTGLPGEGFIAADDVPSAQADVYEQDWFMHAPPSAELLLHASDGMIARQARGEGLPRR